MYPIRLFIATLLPLLPAASTVGVAGQDKVAKRQIHQVKEALFDVIHEVEQLEESAAADLSGQTRARIYRQADELLGKLLTVYEKLDAQTSRKQMYRLFKSVDSQIHDLVDACQATGNRTLERIAKELSFADLEWHFQIFIGDDSTEKKQKVLRRQIKAFAGTARKLKSVAAILTASPTTDTIHKLAQKVEKLEAAADDDASFESLQKIFKDVNLAWEKMVSKLKLLPPRKNVYLLRSAVRLDKLHDRMFRLLQMPGKRAEFTIRI